MLLWFLELRFAVRSENAASAGVVGRRWWLLYRPIVAIGMKYPLLAMLEHMLFDAPLPRPAVKVAPGVSHVPGWLGLDEQRGLVEQMRGYARRLAGTPVAMRRPVLKSGQMSVFMMQLGKYWQTQPYAYVDAVDGVRVPPVPDNLQAIAERALTAAAEVAKELRPWVEGFSAQTALVNFYPPDATMGMHVDNNESSPAPVVSLSIGQEAIFRIGNTESKNKPWDDVLLASGDLVVFGGPARFAYHGIPKLLPGTTPRGCGLDAGGTDAGRINITLRQVYV